MKSLLLGAAMAALLVPAALAQTGTGADAAMMEAPGKYLVFFPWNKATLTEDDQRVVGEAAAEFKRTGSARIDVTGFTDTSGSPAYNLRLSERRAEMVAAAKKGSGTVEYMWKNPESGKVEAKVSYLKKAGDQVCGVGAYK